MSTGFGYTFPAIKGIQSGKEYYTSMIPLKLVPKLFSYNEEDVPDIMRSQRILNVSRIGEIAKYITQNKTSYVLSSLTVAINSEIEFEIIENPQYKGMMGLIHIPLEAQFILNDGQHRRAGISEALKENPELGEETISVVFFQDLDLKNSQQMFVDLSKQASKQSKSIRILNDHTDKEAMITKNIILELDFFRKLTEMEKTTLAKRSKKLFTLSAIHGAIQNLFKGFNNIDDKKKIEVGKVFWSELYNQFEDWQKVFNSEIIASTIRINSLHSHGIILSALGRLGNSIINFENDNWKSQIKNLKNIDWNKTNINWNGRALINGRASKSDICIALTTNYIKQELNLPLNKKEQIKENKFKKVNKG